MPHLGHEPGLSLCTSGCIGQVYTTFASAGLLELPQDVIPAAIKAANENKKITFFIMIEF
jgi:hypothetical protein